MKYRLSQIAAVVGGRFSGTDCEVQSVVTDSRSLTCELGSGPVFVAMCGAHHESHAFVAQMYARGVRAVMVERPLDALPECGYVVVENAIAALQCLAAYHRAQFRGTVVGITGSNGKTVIKEWIAEELTAAQRMQGVDYFALSKQEGTVRGMLRGVLASTAALAVIPMADWLEETAAARMNTPGQAQGNWQWRADAKKLTPALAAEIRVLTERYFRAAK